MTKAQAVPFQRLSLDTGAYGTYDLVCSQKKEKRSSPIGLSGARVQPSVILIILVEATAGIYLLDDDQMLRFAAIDIDVYPIDHASISVQLNEWVCPWLCSSKSGGAHIYIFSQARKPGVCQGASKI